jgi:ubiquitin C-terminal hydrolase
VFLQRCFHGWANTETLEETWRITMFPQQCFLVCPRLNVGFVFIDCLDSFTKVEELQESEQYFCPRCKKRQISTKKLSIQRLPNVSANVQWRKFTFSSGRGGGAKPPKFPTKLSNFR